MRAILLVAMLALAASSSIPVAAADHLPEDCAGDKDVAAVCPFHVNGADCYALWVAGQHLREFDFC
jgi:hypothetical protein